MTSFANMDGLAMAMPSTNDIDLAHYDLSDSGNAARFIVRHGARFLYLRGADWMVFTGTHWERHGGATLAQLAAEQTVQSIDDEIEALEKAHRLHDEFDAWAAAKPAARRGMGEVHRIAVDIAKLRDWRTRSGQVTRLRGMLAIAADHLTVDIEAFDSDPYALNVQNGTLRFFTNRKVEGRPVWDVRLDPHNPADRISRICKVAWKKEAPCALWESHLLRTMPDHTERRFLQRMLGYTCLGLTKEQCFFLWQGRGGDGKSLTANTVRRVLGSYAETADVQTFLEEKNGQRSAAQASPDLARLAGATRFVSTSEPPRGSRLKEGLIKQATGGAPLTARHLQRDLFTFIPAFKLVIECNARPAIGGSDDGIWRRVVFIPWRVQLQRHEMDVELEAKLTAEHEGVLAWLVDGVIKYLDRGLDPPVTIESAHADYKKGSNSFREWMEDYTVFDAEHVALMSDLYKSFSTAMEDMGIEPMNQRAFGNALSDHQIMITSRDPNNRRARRKGLRLKTEFERHADAENRSEPEANPAEPARSAAGGGEINPEDWSSYADN